jgi:hypothetical protein
MRLPDDVRPIGLVDTREVGDGVRREFSPVQELLLSIGLESTDYASLQAFQAADLPERPSCILTDVRLPDGKVSISSPERRARRYAVALGRKGFVLASRPGWTTEGLDFAIPVRPPWPPSRLPTGKRAFERRFNVVLAADIE